MPSSEPLTNVDAAWLGMEDPTNLMMVSGILTFDGPINFERLRAVLERRLLPISRFRQRVVQPKLPFTTPYWEYDPTFNLDNHLHRVALPAPGDKKALQEMVSDLMSTPLDFSKPLWHFHVIENYEGGGVLMGRLHHCIADGIALIQVLLSLTDFSAEAPLPPPPEEDDRDGQGGGVIQALIQQAASAVKTARKVSGKVVSEGLEAIINPAHALELALSGTDHAVAAGRLVLRTSDPQTIFKGALGVQKRAAWSRPLPLKDIKAIKNVTGGTVNDVLVSAMTGALRQYLVAKGQDVEDLNFRAAVPVNIRKPEEMTQLGNKFGIVFLSLPVGIADPLDRLAEVRKRMLALKNSPEAIAAFGILGAIGMNPKAIQEQIVNMFGAKTTCVMTNVPGPQFPLYLAGSRIKDFMFWVPQSGRVGLGISIMSYDQQVFLGVATDAGLVPEPDEIVNYFYDEFDALMALVKTAEAVEQAETRKKAQTVEAEKPAADVETAVTCQATTKSGKPCKLKPMAGSPYCHVHQNQA